MTFFYDLNKRMAELSQKQTLSEGAVAESNKWIQGAVNPAHKGDLHKALHVAAGEKIPKAKINKATHSSDPHLRHMAQFAKNVAPKQEGVGEGDTSSPTKTTGGRANMPTSDVRSKYYPPAKPPVKKFAQPTTAFDRSKTGGLSTAYAQDQASRPAGMNPDPASRYAMGEEGLPMTTVNGKKVPKFAADGRGANDLAKKKSFNDKIAGAKQEVEEMLGDVAAEAIKSALSPKQKKHIDKNHNGEIDANDFEMLRRGGKKQMADEGFDDMISDVKKRMGPKVGDVKRGARHDIETTATGIRATRRHDDETDDQPTGEKRRAGRPKGADKGPERVTGKAYKHKGGRVKEDGMEDMIEPHDSGEYDHEGEMAKDSIKTVVRHAQALEKILGDNDNLPEWVQSKLAKIESMMTAVDDYMQNQEGDDEMAMDEEKTSTRDSRAERAGRKVAKDIEYDEKKKDGIHGKRRGSEDDKAEKAGKRVTKDIEYDEKKKEKKVAETTTSGSVATGGDAPKAGKGGVQIGKGIYDSLNRKLENMIAESMSINVSMTKDDNGSHKNITVTAADEDAEALAQLLRSAGLGGGMSHDHGHEEPCPDCGSTDCGCDEGMAEAYGDTDASQNEPNWPTDTEYSDDALQYSGGLNGPKSTGQTTIPVIAHQGARTGVDDEELRRMMEMAGIKQQELKPWERTMKEDTIEEDELDEGWKEKMAAAALAGSMALGAGGAHAGTSGNQDAGSNTPQQAAGQTVGSMAQAQRINYQLRSMINTVKDLKQQNRLDPGFEKDYNQMQTVSNTGSPDSKVAGDFANAKMLKQLFQKYNMTLPYVQEDVAEGVVNTVKGAVKKGLEKLGHGSDEDMRKDLQKKMGVPPTGKKPEDKKMEESLMKEFANFRI